ncbi:heavy metal-associated isoprenylated plant protein 39-like [Cryptomeria japonica]|uniref:heavy metal-associated isoprenylated plant protein 39-like n=1 Tax=Cryptomeria japonica TaxID=3369 RepID=UPI0027D9F110|nr:heavy metal-associated isoprenylated plant protein 39-like [Cryptomeria japonica]
MSSYSVASHVLTYALKADKKRVNYNSDKIGHRGLQQEEKGPYSGFQMLKKIVLKVAIENESSKKKALKQVAGVDSVAVDMKEKKMTVIGDVDPVHLICKLRKLGFADLLSVGPAKEDKKGGEKKEEKKPQGNAKKENKAESPNVVYVPIGYYYRPYEYTVVREEYPNTCVIC